MLVGSILNRSGHFWTSHFPSCPPVGRFLQTEMSGVWRRFATCESPARIPRSANELDIAVQRTSLLAEQILSENKVSVIVSLKEPTVDQPLRLDSDWMLEGLELKRAFRWVDPFEETPDQTIWSAYSGRVSQDSDIFRRIVTSIASNTLEDIICIAPESRIIFAPGQGFVDAFIPDAAKREALDGRFSKWRLDNVCASKQEARDQG